MIVDLEKFLEQATPQWEALEALVARLEADPARRLDLTEARRFHQLYRRATADLVRLESFPAEAEVRSYLEALVVRAYGEIHDNRAGRGDEHPFRRLLTSFPRAFRRRRRAFALAVGITLVGCLFGAVLLARDPDAKAAVLPFEHLAGDPAERVAKEEAGQEAKIEGHQVAFSSYLMTHNTRVAVFCLATGITWGIGTLILLFYNGVILGMVAFDYLRAGQGTFLLGWLLPHGAVEIPAILVAGQAGLTLAGALLGRRDGLPLGTRLRRVGGDLAALILGAGLMLIWAGIVESFLSQHHEPVIPYSLKIGFGIMELAILAAYLLRAGRRKESS